MTMKLENATWKFRGVTALGRSVGLVPQRTQYPIKVQEVHVCVHAVFLHWITVAGTESSVTEVSFSHKAPLMLFYNEPQWQHCQGAINGSCWERTVFLAKLHWLCAWVATLFMRIQWIYSLANCKCVYFIHSFQGRRFHSFYIIHRGPELRHVCSS